MYGSRNNRWTIIDWAIETGWNAIIPSRHQKQTHEQDKKSTQGKKARHFPKA